MKKLDPAQITAKSVEISKCLLNTQAGMVTLDLGDTRTIGDAARLAVSIKQLRERMKRETFAAVSSALKIDFRLAQSELLPLFEKLDWAEVKWKGSHVESLIERIPPTEDILSTLGNVWEERNPTLIDRASVQALARLSKRPYSREAIVSDLEIADEGFEHVLNYGEQARYLGKFTSQEHGVETIWTPLYWATNADKVQTFLAKQSEDRLRSIAKLVDDFREYPGKPKEQMSSQMRPLLKAGIWHGFFPTGKVEDRQKTSHEYIFSATPQFEAEPKKDIFEKARMIVSCIRHGQHHAEITKILYPRSILKAMRTNVMKPHPYANIQYAILVLNGIVRLEPASTRYGKAWQVRWIDTPENNLAADVAVQMLRGDVPLAGTKEEVEARKILVQGMYNYSSEQRRLRVAEKIIAKREYDRMLELIGGVKF